MFSIKLNYPLFLLMCFVVRLLVQDDFRVLHLGGSFQLFFCLFSERYIEFIALPSEEIYYHVK